MRPSTLLLLFCLLLSLPAEAQKDSLKTAKKERTVRLYGEVYDSFTKAKIKAHVILMRQDSTVVDTMTCWTWDTESYYEFKIPAREGHYIIKGTCEGYHDAYLNYHLRYLARNNSFKLPRLLMKKKQDDIWRESDLDGVVVKGTKVKIAYRGDTIVYNASAFNLPEGSMLDGLIRQMPGAELKDNGDIYINGRKVDYLTLNGKDFFKGQNKVVLDNLPYFTVENIKVYDKSTKQSELIGHDVEKKDYVMDVVLKREYNRGYLANVEAGGGTDSRYLARMFGLYYDDHSRASVFANTNNVNESHHPGSEGDWSPSNTPQGLHTTKQVGLHFETEQKDKRWEESLDATFEWTKADDETRTVSERFATEGNLTGGSWARSLQKDFRFSASNRFSMKLPFTLLSDISVNYVSSQRSNENQDSTLRSALINRTRNESSGRYRTFGINGYIAYSNKFEWGDYLSIYFKGSYERNNPNETFSLKHADFAQMSEDEGNSELRHYYNDAHGEDYAYTLRADYTLQLPKNWFISTAADYTQSYSAGVDDYYRLDYLDEVAADKQELEWLPSTNQLLMSVIDLLNNGEDRQLTRQYSGRLNIYQSSDNGYFSLSLPVEHLRERYIYHEVLFDTIAYRNYTRFTPSISYFHWSNKPGLRLRSASYNLSVNHPSLMSLMPFDDTTNPVAVTINNPDLKSTISHQFNIALQSNSDTLRRFFSISSGLQLTQRAVGTRTFYNTKSGAYLLEQDNIDGNWTWNLNTNYEMPIDKKKRLTLRQEASVDYTHSVDFDIQYVSDGSEFFEKPTSTVNNWVLHEQLGLEYQKDKLTVGMRGEVNWRSSTGNRQNFERISAFDYNYGGHLRYTIPWVKVSLGTDLRMFSRRGYQSDMMNTDDLVWNAELSRSLFKEKLTMKLTAFDLLHQLSNKRYSVDAQGRTETWNNSIPRYVMFSLMYKFTQKPKGK